MSILILPGAAEELDSAAAYYQSEKDGLGQRFLETFQAAVAEIIEAPMMYSPLGWGYRKFGLRPFPYAIIYRVELDDLVIVAVMHQKRRPGYWLGRELE